jgi:hypothetical protein
LATVLRVSRLREEAARLRLAQALTRAAASRRALAETQKLMADRLAALAGDAPPARSAQDFLLHLRYLEHLSRAVGGWRERLAQDEAEADRERQTLVQHHQKTYLLERLPGQGLGPGSGGNWPGAWNRKPRRWCCPASAPGARAEPGLTTGAPRE